MEYAELKNQIIYICLAGSRAYGLNNEDSDWDYRGVFISPINDLIGLYKPEETHQYADEIGTYHEVRKFFHLAAKGNPSVLEMLYAPVIYAAAIFQPVLDNRHLFLSKQAVPAFVGYAKSEFYQNTNRAEIKWKSVMHSLRLLNSLFHLLNDNDMEVAVDDTARELFVSIRQGLRSFEFCEMHFKEYLRVIDNVKDYTDIPEAPDYEKINKLLLEIRWNFVSRKE